MIRSGPLCALGIENSLSIFAAFRASELRLAGIGVLSPILASEIHSKVVRGYLNLFYPKISESFRLLFFSTGEI